MQYKYPYTIDRHGRTASASEEGHLNQLIEQVLFTSPGERVNRPTFGSGVNQLVFAPNSNELATLTQFMVQAALQQWLADLISVESVVVKSEESTLFVTIQYVVKKNQQRYNAEFSRAV